ncbi:alpha/beta fold hydrolase [Pseudoruegeria sp. HB172150]|uniref:alpha/beta fold hydrolase n=1 Tax=Pseudoruegeria sp. HB172150 TaxID=2721164 RepID=UPI00155568B6|nr:alpha/beta fold hydrolase [Pseudoruegeria sp. HB172150]
MTPEKIIALVAALVSGEPDPSTFPNVTGGSADPRYPVAVTPCHRPVAPAEIEGETVICGTVTVPEDHDAPDGKTLDLSFIVYKSHSLAPAPDAVVHLHGGPGGGIVGAVASTTYYFDHLRGRRDIVAFDQRGVDASGPGMDCFNTLAENVEPVVRRMMGEAAPDLDNTLITECLAELGERGYDLSKINTEQNARDVQAVMRALGYPEYNVYGISYGTKLGLEVMRTAPDGVRSVVLDSVAPPHIPTYDTLITPHVEAIENTFAPCAADPACAEAYPDILTRFWAVLDKLQESPVQTSAGMIDGETLFEMIDDRNDWTKMELRGLTTYLPLLVSELEEDKTDTLEAIMTHRLPPQQTAETIMAGAKGLTPDETVLAQTALDDALTMKGAEQSALRAITQLEGDIAASRADEDLAAYFDAELERAMQKLPEAAQRVAFAQDYLRLRFEEPDRAAFGVLIAGHFRGEEAARLQAILALMSNPEIATTFEKIATDNAVLEQVMEGQFELYLYACQEDMDINSPEGFRAETDRLAMAGTLAKEAAETPPLFANCDLFTMSPRPGFHDPVTSDIPAMVFSGELDTQTAGSWGPETASHLGNARSVFFPETGHGALAFSQCARDIGVAFIENPEADIDTSCAQDLRLPYALPDGTTTRP